MAFQLKAKESLSEGITRNVRRAGDRTDAVAIGVRRDFIQL
jgi:hypothetical protein